jgi:hypothetical protein
MIYEWIDRNVELHTIVEDITVFLQDKDFKVVAEEEKNKWIISAARTIENRGYSVVTRVYGTPNDLFVEFSHDDVGRVFVRFQNLLSFMGLGVLVRRELERDPFMERFEDDFWNYLEADMERRRRPK